MSNKTGGSDQVLTLPKGSGALKGIGDTFPPDLHTGTGNFTGPISLPPEATDYNPKLISPYSTGLGNGVFRVGCSVSIPGVRSKTSSGCWRILIGKNASLKLMVLAPEDADSGGPPLVLFSSKLLRVNSGRAEAYMIRISSAQLENAKIKGPVAKQDDDTPASKVQKYKKARVD